MPIIEVDHVSKDFQLGTITSMKDSLLNVGRRLRGKPAEGRAPFKALDDVDFRIEPGEVVGIIGQNGAGKSTLLKLLANISKPTRGSVTVRGKVAPLIEVGAGLVPELTGRENIFLNATILGIPKMVIASQFDEIVSFAELDDFIDTPIKRYSSGMKVRLGFSIATSITAEVLIVDEVLAVGDLAFQRKCFDRIEDLIKGRGSTVLLVSHNIRQVERMCSRVMLLERGKVAADGPPLEVAELFYRRSNDRIEAYQKSVLGGKASVLSSGEIELLSIDVLDDQHLPVEAIPSGGALRIRVAFQVHQPLVRPEIVVGTHTTDFFYLSASSTATLDERPDLDVGTHEVEYIVPSFPLVAGTYCIRFAVFDQYRRKVFTGEGLKTFSVTSDSTELKEAPLRRLNLPTQWRLGGRLHAVSNTAQNRAEAAYP